MQVIVRGRTLHNHTAQRILCRILSNPDAIAILDEIKDAPKSAAELQKTLCLSRSKLYRLLKKLADIKFLKTIFTSRTGKRIRLYKCEISSISFD
jgi:predicted transcriptional regulator